MLWMLRRRWIYRCQVEGEEAEGKRGAKIAGAARLATETSETSLKPSATNRCWLRGSRQAPATVLIESSVLVDIKSSSVLPKFGHECHVVAAFTITSGRYTEGGEG